MTAKPTRLTKNRHGTYCLRLVVPTRYRGPDGQPREVRVSLRTKEPVRARILVLEFNLALERIKTMTNDFDPRKMLAPWTLQTNTLKIEVKDSDDQKNFNQWLETHPDIREELLKSIRSGVNPNDALAAVMTTFKGALGSAASAGAPTKLRDAINKFVGSRTTLSNNRRSTAGEKERTLELLFESQVSAGKDPESIAVHDLSRPALLDFVSAYSARQGKDAGKKSESLDEKTNKSGGSKVDGKEPAASKPLSPRTVVKAIGHIKDFFDYAVAQQWVMANPIDDAFEKAVGGLKIGASQAKSANSYEVFTDDELRQIFEPRKYLLNCNAADEFWVPLIGLYTGARLGEIVVLTPDSIALDRDAGVFCMSVGTKNENSKRSVPIPNALINLGFMDYVHFVQDLGAASLFPHRPINDTRADDPSKHMSRAFAEHLTDIGVKAKGKVFHSFRHTLITRMHVNNVPVGDAELIVGHAAQDLHVRLSASGGRGSGQHGSTHLGTYVQSAAYADANVPLLVRLKIHLDSSPRFPIDITKLAAVARVVQSHLIVKGEGADVVYKSGWHTNKKGYGEQIATQLSL